MKTLKSITIIITLIVHSCVFSQGSDVFDGNDLDPSFVAVPSYVPTNGLVGYWGFNGNANDQSGNGNNGTVNGATLTTDRNGNANSAYSFDGVGNYINIANNVLPTTSTSLTISLWFLSSDNDGHLISDRSGAGNTSKYSISTGGTVIGSGCENGNCAGSCGQYLTTIAPSGTTWNNAVLVKDLSSNVCKIYLNGVLAGTRNNFCYTNFSSPTAIGRGNSYYAPFADGYVNGKIDDVGIWNRALTEAEITQLYTSASSFQTLCTKTIQPYNVNVGDATHDGSTYAWSILPATPSAVMTGNGTNAITIDWTNAPSGTYTLQAIETNAAGCVSTAVSATINLSTTPTAPAAPAAQTFCTASTVANLTAAGTTLQWYDVATGGTAMASTTALVSGTTYYVSQTVGTCESTRTPVAVTITPLTAPTAVAQTFCNSATVANLVATGTAIKWYSAATGGTALASTTALVTGTTYYASQTVGTCESTRTAVVVTVNPNPTIVTQTATICSGSAFYITPRNGGGNVVPNGTTYTWSVPVSNPTGAVVGGIAQTTGIGTISQTLTNLTITPVTIIYTVTPSSGTCIGSTFNIIVTVNPKPVSLALTNKSFCSGVATTPIVFNNTVTGTTYAWTNSSPLIGLLTANGSGSIPVFTPTNSGFAAIISAISVIATANGCSSLAETFTITVNPSASVTFSPAPQTICSGNNSANVTLSSTTPGVSFAWTAIAPINTTGVVTSGTATIPSQFITNSTNADISVTYNATATTSSGANCLGALYPYVINIKPKSYITEAFTSTACSGSAFTITPANSSLNSVPAGTIYSWPAPTVTGGMTGGLAGINQTNIFGTLNNLTNTVQTATYNVTPTSGTCVGSTFTITVAVSPTGSPTAVAQTFCTSATVANLVATGTAIKWYATLTGGAVLASTTALVTGTTYYASQTVGTCESTRTAVAVTITPLTAPTAVAQSFCNSATVANLVATGTAIKWYAAATGGTALTSTTALVTSTTYYASQTVGSCESTRKAVAVTITPRTTPTFTQVAPICAGATLAALPTTSTNGVTGTWSPAINNTTTTTYTFTPTAGLCANTATMTITVNPIVTPTFTTVASICSNATMTPLPTTSNNGITGTWSPALNNTTTTTYTFTPTAGQCANTTTQTITITAPKVTSAISFVAPVAALPSVTIGTQIWTNKNLDVTTYRDGTPIPQVTDPTAWANLTTGAWCYYNNDPTNGTIYGKLYNWYAVAGIHDNDPNTPNKILAPLGWHVPSYNEWDTLTTFLGGESVAGGKMKEVGMAHWNSPNTSATNTSTFTGLPGGARISEGSFIFIGYAGYWWSSSEYDSSNAWFRVLGYDDSAAGRGNYAKWFGYSVRCFKD
jgi:uncharacterized protein (TIGR02145 family)